VAQAESGCHLIPQYLILDAEWKLRYDRVTYPSFVDKFYQDNEYTAKQIGYDDYLATLDRLALADQRPIKQE
jgi:hypothetical protein